MNALKHNVYIDTSTYEYTDLETLQHHYNPVLPQILGGARVVEGGWGYIYIYIYLYIYNCANMCVHACMAFVACLRASVRAK